MKICVFCGSRSGKNEIYGKEAVSLAQEMAKRQIGLVYGGAKIGLMGLLADTVMKEGGTVQGVMVDSLAEKEIAHRGLTELYCVATMHERKKKMYDLADAFIAFPGGLGTLDEFFEIVTWKQIGLHAKPCALLNVNGYYDSLISFINKGVEEDFIRPGKVPLIKIETDIGKLLSHLQEGGNGSPVS